MFIPEPFSEAMRQLKPAPGLFPARAGRRWPRRSRAASYSGLVGAWTPGAPLSGSCSHEITLISGVRFVRGCAPTRSRRPLAPEYPVPVWAAHQLAAITQLYCPSGAAGYQMESPDPLLAWCRAEANRREYLRGREITLRSAGANRREDACRAGTRGRRLPPDPGSDSRARWPP